MRVGSSLQKTLKSCSSPRWRTATTASLMDSWCQPAVFVNNATLNCSAWAALVASRPTRESSRRRLFLNMVNLCRDNSLSADRRRGERHAAVPAEFLHAGFGLKIGLRDGALDT